jgi:hypothetical protein
VCNLHSLRHHRPERLLLAHSQSDTSQPREPLHFWRSLEVLWQFLVVISPSITANQTPHPGQTAPSQETASGIITSYRAGGNEKILPYRAELVLLQLQPPIPPIPPIPSPLGCSAHLLRIEKGKKNKLCALQYVGRAICALFDLDLTGLAR